MSNNPLTPDEVIAQNVQRLRDERGYSVAHLAERLRVSRHRVYDYERPRPDSPQHAFRWAELIELCAALECTVFELVLPGEDGTVDVPEWVVHGGLRVPEIGIDLEDVDPADVDLDAAEFGVVVVEPPGRRELAEMVFHMPADVLTPEGIAGPMAKRAQQVRDRIREAEMETAREAHRNMIEALRSALADLEQEGDEG